MQCPKRRIYIDYQAESASAWLRPNRRMQFESQRLWALVLPNINPHVGSYLPA